jgi:hypothetical protein
MGPVGCAILLLPVSAGGLEWMSSGNMQPFFAAMILAARKLNDLGRTDSGG